MFNLVILENAFWFEELQYLKRPVEKINPALAEVRRAEKKQLKV